VSRIYDVHVTVTHRVKKTRYVIRNIFWKRRKMFVKFWIYCAQRITVCSTKVCFIINRVCR